MRNQVLAVTAALALGGCLSSLEASRSDDPFDISGGRFQGAALQKVLKKVESSPLGSEENPVRADMPAGQRAYLARLRCTDGQPPDYQRLGSLGEGVFGSIVDAYTVTCKGGEPAASTIIMDMYFPNHEEARPVTGFTIVSP